MRTNSSLGFIAANTAISAVSNGLQFAAVGAAYGAVHNHNLKKRGLRREHNLGHYAVQAGKWGAGIGAIAGGLSAAARVG